MVDTSRLLAIASVCLSSVLSLIPTASALDVKLFGLNYNSRIGPDWAPNAQRCKSADEVALDMKLLAAITNNVRLYSLTDCNQGSLVIDTAISAGLNVSVGLWVGKDGAGFEDEKAKLKELIDRVNSSIISDRIFDIHVGSEALYRKDVDVATSIEYVKQIKAICLNSTHSAKIPVTIADVAKVFYDNPTLIDAVDVVSANAFPFWETWSITTAAQRFKDEMQPLFDLAKNKSKEVFIGETGWASGGSSSHASVASPENALQYFRDFYAMASQNDWKYFYFSAFDEDWKIAKGSEAELDTVEAHFGLFNANRVIKDAFQTLAFTESAPVPEAQKTDVVSPTGAANSNGNAMTGTLTGASANAAIGTPSAASPSAGASTHDKDRCSTN